MFVNFWNLVPGSTGTTWCGRETRLGVGWGEQGVGSSSESRAWAYLGMARLVECRRIQDGKPYRYLGFEWRKHPKLGDFPYLITRGYVRRALERKYYLRKLRLLKSFVICAPPSPSATQWLWVPLGMRRLCCRNSGFLITRAASAVFLLHCGVLIDKQVPDCIIWFASPGMCVWFTLFLVLVKFHTIFGYIWVMYICHMLNWIVQFLNIATNLEMDNLKKKLQGTTEKDMNRPSHPSESSDKSMNITYKIYEHPEDILVKHRLIASSVMPQGVRRLKTGTSWSHTSRLAIAGDCSSARTGRSGFWCPGAYQLYECMNLNNIVCLYHINYMIILYLMHMIIDMHIYIEYTLHLQYN